MLRIIERKIEGLIERTFGRAFKSQLQPVELARKLSREMEQHKTVSVSRVYVPNEFAVYLSSADREEFASYEHSLRAELANYLDAQARGEGLSMVGQAVVLFETDADLRVGEFGIACRMTDQPGGAAPPVVAPEEVMPAAAAGPPPASAPAGEDPFAAHVADSAADAPDEPPAPEEPVAEETPDEESGPAPADATGDEVADDTPDDDAPDAEDDTPADEPADEEVDEPMAADEAEVVAESAPEPDPPPVVSEPEPSPAPEVPLGPVAGAAAGAVEPPPVHDALEGISGTQVFTADQAREAGVPTETMTLIMPGGARHTVSRRVTTVGRGRGNDLVIPDANVSRNHAEIRHIGLDYFLVDLDSTNGVEVNGEQVRRHALADGDVVVIGTTDVIVELS